MYDFNPCFIEPGNWKLAMLWMCIIYSRIAHRGHSAVDQESSVVLEKTSSIRRLFHEAFEFLTFPIDSPIPDLLPKVWKPDKFAATRMNPDSFHARPVTKRADRAR
jgi:hypothetical protein